LWSNGPKECLELPDYSFQEEFGKPIPSFPPREVLRTYFMARVKKNGLLDRFDVRLNTVVRNVEFVNNKFRVVSFQNKTQTTKTELFDYVVVASGHFSMPNLPDYPGANKFPGRLLHSHDFRDARELSVKHVLVVGSSYSAEDIALQCIKYGAKKITCSYRTRPMGFHWPDNMEEVPILTTIEESGIVNFSDGSKRKVDAIIFCTGYKHHFSFLPDELRLQTMNILYPDNLYKGVVWQQNPKCFFMGMQV
jgi:trimethylamine monooxygenase